MILLKILPKLVLISISIFNFCIAVFGWGRPIHYYVNYQAVISVPDEMAAFRNYASWIGSHASDVDRWKSYVEEERYRHYFDLDFYGEYPFKNVPRNLKTLIETYGRKTVRENGVVPWTIEHKYNRLVYLMKLGKWKKAFHVAAALGHYVADAHQPFHSTENFDGQKTGNNGIHSRYESVMTAKYQSEIKWTHSGAISAGALTAIPPAVDTAFDYLILGYGYVEKVIEADTKYAGLLKSDEEKYYKMMWRDTGFFTTNLINKAAEDLAALYYYAWAEAGRPKIPQIAPDELKGIKNLRQWKETFYIALDTSTTTEYYGESEIPDPSPTRHGGYPGGLGSPPDKLSHPPVIP